MKLGVSYNLFDAEEHLESSIKQIRGSVDFISVVYQQTSNFGDKCNPNLVKLLNKLVSKKLVDQIVEYFPLPMVNPHHNEINKRNLGLHLSEKNGCTHHMSMDTDEYYTKDQFENAKKIMVEGDYDSSACQMVTYYKEPFYRLEPKEDYYVSMIYKIKPKKNFIFTHNFPVLVDPTRSMEPENCKIFTRDEIEMHHMSFVRNDISKKLNNSSAKVNFEAFIPEFVRYFNNWEFGQKAITPGKPPREFDTVEVDDIFNIELN